MAWPSAGCWLLAAGAHGQAADGGPRGLREKPAIAGGSVLVRGLRLLLLLLLERLGLLMLLLLLVLRLLRLQRLRMLLLLP